MALYELVRETLESPRLLQEEILRAVGLWKSHQTLHILFGAEEICDVQFSSQQMENVDGFETLLTAISETRAKG